MKGIRRPLTVYLDSSDYSVLSDAKRSHDQAPGVLDFLTAKLTSGEIECVFSAAHLTEMAPLEGRFTDSALKRAALLVNLCGRNAMISHDRLFEQEVKVALGLTVAPVQALDRAGYWFPQGAAEMSPITELDHAKTLETTIAEMPLTRADRRRTTRALMKGGKARAPFRAQLVKNAREASLREVLDLYPMRPADARALARYVVGDATAEEATAAFEESLRDPTWMMLWFREHHNKLSPFIEWVRAPARDITEKLAALTQHVQSLRDRAVLHSALRDELFGAERWQKWQSEMLESVGSRLADRVSPGAKLTADQIDANCPGISTAIRSVHSAWQSVSFDTPRQPKPSDFVDALHASYAPYVDVFRADGFMAPFIERYARRTGTVVVPKLSELPARLKLLSEDKRH